MFVRDYFATAMPLSNGPVNGKQIMRLANTLYAAEQQQKKNAEQKCSRAKMNEISDMEFDVDMNLRSVQMSAVRACVCSCLRVRFFFFFLE